MKKVILNSDELIKHSAELKGVLTNKAMSCILGGDGEGDDGETDPTYQKAYADSTYVRKW